MKKDYFIYLPDQRPGIAGCTLRSAGYTRTLPGGAYPPYQHPTDHHFQWADGRILQSYCILFISEGAGVFESAATRGKKKIDAGTAFLLFPGVWHRYAPDAQTGWVEEWVEYVGPTFDHARKKGLIKPRNPVLTVGLSPHLTSLFSHVYDLAQRTAAAAHQGMLSSLGPHLLATLEHLASPNDPVQHAFDKVIQQARQLISERCHEPLKIEELAQELNVGYSHFRQEFRKQVGVTPKQYHLEARIQEAQKLLANTDLTVQEIAEKLGFYSSFHFSKQFKVLTGHAPSAWREQTQHPIHRPTGKK